MNQELSPLSKSARRSFAYIGWAIFTFFAVTYATQIGLMLLIELFFPSFAETEWAMWLLSAVPMYLLAFPLFCMILTPIKGTAPPETPFRWRYLLICFFIGYFLMYVGNIVGNVVNIFTELFGMQSSSDAIEMIGSSSFLPTLLIAGIIGPIIEEVMFRKLILDRLYPYGEKLAILLSSLLFALFHGNLTQLIYAFLLGLVLSYLYCRTGKLIYPILLHMAINIVGGVLPSLLLKAIAPLMALLESGSEPTPEQLLSMLPLLLLMLAYLFVIFAFCAAGLVLLCCTYKRIRIRPTDTPLERGELPRVLLSAGVILAAVTFIGLFILSYL